MAYTPIAKRQKEEEKIITTPQVNGFSKFAEPGIAYKEAVKKDSEVGMSKFTPVPKDVLSLDLDTQTGGVKTPNIWDERKETPVVEIGGKILDTINKGYTAKADDTKLDVAVGAAQEFPKKALQFLTAVGGGEADAAKAILQYADRWDVGSDNTKKTIKALDDYSEKAYKSVSDRNKALDTFGNVVGSQAFYFLPGLGISKLSNVQKLSKINDLSKWLGIGASSILESAGEAGSVYKNEKEKNGEEVAKGKSDFAFLANIVLNTITNKVGGTFNVDKAKSFLGEGVKILAGATSEGTQETIQQFISNIAEDRPITEGSLEAGLYGALLGGFGGGGNISQNSKISDFFPDKTVFKKIQSLAKQAIKDERGFAKITKSEKKYVPVSERKSRKEALLERVAEKRKAEIEQQKTGEKEASIDKIIASKPEVIKNVKELVDYELKTRPKWDQPSREQIDIVKEKINNGEKIEPILIMKDETGNFGVEDGKHRLQAFNELGIKEIPTKDITNIAEDIAKSNKEDVLIQEAKKFKSADEFAKTYGNTVYHGTSLENANKINAEGFKVGVGKGVSGEASKDFIYATKDKAGANRYVSDRIGIKNPTIIDSNFNGKILEIQGKMADFEAFGEASKKLGVPLEIGSQGKPTMLNIPAIKKAMQEQGYSAISFLDRYANGTKAYAVLPNQIKTKSQLKDIWEKANKETKPQYEKKQTPLEKNITTKKPTDKLAEKTKPTETKKEVKPVEPKIVKTEEIKKEKLPEILYEDNRAVSKNKKITLVKDIKEVISGIAEGTDKYLGSISTRLKNINPVFKRELRKFEFKVRDNILKDTKKVKPFLDATKKISRDDAIDFDLARKNGDIVKINEIVKKYGIEKEYNNVKKTLDDLYKRAKDAGYDVGYIEDYSPRIIKDRKGFIDYFREGKDWKSIDQAIKSKENDLQRNLTEEEKVQLINTFIRGYDQNKVSLAGTGNMKNRKIDIINGELNQFYMGSDASLVQYIKQLNESVETRSFFGKGKVKEGTVLEDSIGNYLLKKLNEEVITPKQEEILTEILRARFTESGTRGVINLYKNLSYIDTMGSVTPSITQLGDLTWALYKGGVVNTVTSYSRALVGKSKITKNDIGIDNIAQEFEEPNKSAKAVDRVFKLNFLNKMDSFGKETLINSVITKYQTWAEKGDKRLSKALEPVFGKDTKEYNQVIKDLKSGDITENVKLLAFNELADVQPILLSEMPQKYLTGGNGRIFYMLKTFTLKQFDIYRNEIFQQIGDKETRVQGIRNLIRIVGFFVIMNATADEIKDFILNRKTSLKDRTVDNILRAVGFSKYLTWKVRSEGLGSGLTRQVLPPFKFIDSVSKDVTKGIENGSEVVQSIPIGGKLYYWWFGKGQYKNKERVKDNTTTKLEEFEKRIEKLQNKSKLEDFEKRIEKIQSR